MLFVFLLYDLMSLICCVKTSCSYFHHDHHLSLDLNFTALWLALLVVKSRILIATTFPQAHSCLESAECICRLVRVHYLIFLATLVLASGISNSQLVPTCNTIYERGFFALAVMVYAVIGGWGLKHEFGEVAASWCSWFPLCIWMNLLNTIPSNILIQQAQPVCVMLDVNEWRHVPEENWLNLISCTTVCFYELI
jgi:hypothetical protein